MSRYYKTRTCNVSLDVRCVSTTLLSVVTAWLIAWPWRFATPRGRQWIELCVLLPFWLSILIRAFAWLVLLRHEGLISHALTLVIANPLALVYAMNWGR